VIAPVRKLKLSNREMQNTETYLDVHGWSIGQRTCIMLTCKKKVQMAEILQWRFALC